MLSLYSMYVCILTILLVINIQRFYCIRNLKIIINEHPKVNNSKQIIYQLFSEFKLKVVKKL